MLTVLAHCRRFDEALWLDLGQAFRNGLLPFAFNDLQSFSFVEALDDGWSSLHALMREGLCGRTARNEPVLHVEIHRRLFAWWDERCRLVDLRSIASSHELALEEAAFHRAVFERGTFGDWARERGVPFARAGRFGVARDLWEAALAVEKAALPEHDSRIARTLNNLGNVLESLGDLDGAFALQTQALEIRRRAPCPDHQGIAGTLNALANVVPPHGRVPTSVSVP